MVSNRTVALGTTAMISRLQLESDGVAYQPSRPNISAYRWIVKLVPTGFRNSKPLSSITRAWSLLDAETEGETRQRFGVKDGKELRV